MLEQQGLLKALRKSQPNNTKTLGCKELQERVVAIIRLCLANEVLYHVMELKSPGEV